jgi:UDP-N-acetylglucosamine--N-acetylmuramyl-(pentapeptide) pyrophosphoryl-undecaprenol N-acetylglucosamine transferase
VALLALLSIYPDVVFAKGGGVSVPTLFAARLLRIPIIIHESDSVPGRTNEWAGKFATRIALSYGDAAAHFPQEKVAVTGQPIRSSILREEGGDPHAFFGLEENVPTLLVLGGSLGAEKINTAILTSLPHLVENVQIIHQTGEINSRAAQEASHIILAGNQHHSRYHHYPFLGPEELRCAASVADLVITRAGSTLFEVAAWGIPAIVVPITESNKDHQRSNAYAYSRSGAGTVIEEANLTDDILVAEIRRILESKEIQSSMKEAARKFSPPDAARTIASEILYIAESHE